MGSLGVRNLLEKLGEKKMQFKVATQTQTQTQINPDSRMPFELSNPTACWSIVLAICFHSLQISYIYKFEIWCDIIFNTNKVYILFKYLYIWGI